MMGSYLLGSNEKAKNSEVRIVDFSRLVITTSRKKSEMPTHSAENPELH